MHIGKGAAQSVLIGRHHDHVDVVGHQAIAPHLRAAPLGCLRQKIAVECIVSLLEKRLRPPIAALGHVVGDAGEDNTGKASHPRSMGYLVHLVNWHRNSGTVIPGTVIP